MDAYSPSSAFPSHSLLALVDGVPVGPLDRHYLDPCLLPADIFRPSDNVVFPLEVLDDEYAFGFEQRFMAQLVLEEEAVKVRSI